MINGDIGSRDGEAIVYGSDFGLLGIGLSAGVALGWWLQSQVLALRSRRSPTLEPEFPSSPVQGGERELKALLYQAPIGYLQVDEENQLMWCNAAASGLLGIAYGQQDPSDTPRLLLEWVRSYELDHLIEETRLTQTPCEDEWTLNLVSPDPLHPNEGVAYPLRGYSVPLSRGQVGVFLENRQEAVTLLHQRDRWTSDVAHELKTPLTSIRLVAETLRDRVDAPLQSWLDRLLNEILRLSNLVEDLLNLSRLENSGGVGLTLKSTNLTDLLFSAWRSLEPLAQAKQIQLQYDGPPALQVPVDEALMHRVLINLLDNAIKYNPPEGLIWVQASPLAPPADGSRSGAGEMVQIEVIDQGQGFKGTDLPYVFSRFYRADPARARLPLGGVDPTAAAGDNSLRSSNGTGLGLAIVQQIVDAHCGYVTARNHPDTGGGWLTVSLPLAAGVMALTAQD